MLSRLPSSKYSIPLIGAAAAWGIATPISKRAVAEIPPLTLLPIQLGTSLIAFAIVMLVARAGQPWPRNLRAMAWLGVLNPGLAYLLGLIGLSQISASLSVLLWAVEPVAILGLAVWILKERVTPVFGISLALAVGGMALVTFDPGAGGAALGIGLTLAGVLACAIYTVIARRLMVDTSTLTGLIVQQLAALVFAVAVFGIFRLVSSAPIANDVSSTAWVSAAISGVLYYAVGFGLYLIGLRQLPAATAGSFLSLIPLFGIGAGFVLLGERFTGKQWIGAVLIVATMFAIVRQTRSAVDTNA